MNTDQSSPIQILLVEDSDSDAKLTKKALKTAKVINELHRVTDGVQALEFLRKLGVYKGVQLPDLILLDLNLPRKRGQDVLEEIKNDPVLKAIPVIILTSSRDDEDVLRAYKLHANSYVTKPVDFKKFIDIIQSIENFWLAAVTLPKIKDEHG